MIDTEREFNNYLTYCLKQKKLSTHTLKAYKIDITQYRSFAGKLTINKDVLVSYIRHLHETY